MKIKVCGMRNPENVDLAEQAGVDMVGFIFYPGSKRYVGDIDPVKTRSVDRVGVFVNEAPSRIGRLVEKWDLDYIQLHGDETPEECRQIAALGLPVVKAFSVGEDFDFDQVDSYCDAVDYFLFDTKGQNYGGNGQRFDWHILEGYELEVPFWLSGGIGPEMAAEIAKLNVPGLYAVDVNSKFEDEPGMKNIEKLKKFVDELQS